MQGILEQNSIAERLTNRPKEPLGRKISLMGKLFGCWHKRLSRPFSDQTSAYRACLECGARRKFDAETLISSGSFYYPPAVSFSEN